MSYTNHLGRYPGDELFHDNDASAPPRSLKYPWCSVWNTPAGSYFSETRTRRSRFSAG